MAEQPTKAALAREVWRRMFDFLMRSAPQRAKSLGYRGLTPNDSRALFSLDGHEGRSMGALANEWECDASNATWVVDRLEKLGLAVRRSVAHDRRVKLVVLTAKGAKIKAELNAEFHTPPIELLELERSELEDLLRAVEKLPAAPGAD